MKKWSERKTFQSSKHYIFKWRQKNMESIQQKSKKWRQKTELIYIDNILISQPKCRTMSNNVEQCPAMSNKCRTNSWNCRKVGHAFVHVSEFGQKKFYFSFLSFCNIYISFFFPSFFFSFLCSCLKGVSSD